MPLIVSQWNLLANATANLGFGLGPFGQTTFGGNQAASNFITGGSSLIVTLDSLNRVQIQYADGVHAEAIANLLALNTVIVDSKGVMTLSGGNQYTLANFDEVCSKLSFSGYSVTKVI